MSEATMDPRADGAGPTAEARVRRAVRVTRIAVGVFWAAVVGSVLASFAGDSPVKPSTGHRLAQLAVIPEGWSFFTRDPHEPKDVVYRVEGGRLVPLTFANTSRASLFGVSRAARAADGEAMGLLAPVLESSWTDCRGPAGSCLARARPLALTNWSTTRFLCGNLVVVRAPPVPWGWQHARGRISMPSKVLSVEAGCGRNRPLRYR